MTPKFSDTLSKGKWGLFLLPLNLDVLMTASTKSMTGLGHERPGSFHPGA